MAVAARRDRPPIGSATACTCGGLSGVSAPGTADHHHPHPDCGFAAIDAAPARHHTGDGLDSTRGTRRHREAGRFGPARDDRLHRVADITSGFPTGNDRSRSSPDDGRGLDGQDRR